VRILTAVALLALVACSSAPPKATSIAPAGSAEEIAERLFDARRRGDVKDAWACFAGRTEVKRIYLHHQGRRRGLTWEEFQRDFSMRWAAPALAPAEVWSQVDSREERGVRILVFRQGTEEDPDRGTVEIATCPVGTGWLVAWVTAPR